MKIIDITQRTPAWHRWRSEGITASEAAVVLGRSPFQTPWRLWAERTGLTRPDDLSKNFFVQRGIDLEDAARQGFEQRHNTLLLPVCVESDEHPVLRASLDGLNDDGEPVELKVPGTKVFTEVAEQGTGSDAYQLYWVQVQHQIYVTGVSRGWLVFHRHADTHLEFEIPRDEEFIAQTLVPGCLAFKEAIDKKQEPARDPERDLYLPHDEDEKIWTELAGEYRGLVAEKARLDALAKEAKASMDGLQQRLVAMMGEFVLAESAGIRVLRYSQDGAIDYRAIVEELLTDVAAEKLEEHRKAPSDHVRITVQKEDKATVPFNGKAVDTVWKGANADRLSFYF
jgi:putative phage-type endonuclease